MKRLRLWLEFSRPFTLVAPALGFVSGAVTAWGAPPRNPWTRGSVLYPAVGALMAAILNAGNNALNQIYDLEIDRINKPKRPLPSGRMAIARGLDVHVGHLRDRARAGLARRARATGTSASGSSSPRRSRPSCTPAAVPNEAAWHLGERHDRHPARRAAEGRRLVVGQDDLRRRALVHRRDFRPLPARRVHHEGFCRHGR